MEEQLDKELLFHLDHHTADLVAKGLNPEDARRRARIELGGPDQVKESCRDARGTRWLEDLWNDFRYALRTLRNKAGFAVVALLTLALGIGATTVMFTVVNSVLLKPLPYPQPERLLHIQEQTDWSNQFGNIWAVTYPNFLDCKRSVRSIDMAAYRYAGGTLSAPGDAEYLDRYEVSADIFSILGVPVLRGRVFLPQEDRPGAAPVAIISYGLWQQRFAGNDSVLGAGLVFDGKRYTIVGVTPAGFRIGADVDVYTPVGQDTSPMMQNRQRHAFAVKARLHPGGTLTETQAELAAVGRALAQQYPDSNKGRSFIAEPLRPDVDDVRSTLWLLLGAVSLVLVIACANIASLLLARAISRERELAMRVALGAGRGRLARQCLTESAVLALGGGALGIGLATAGLRPFITFWPGSLPRADEVALDWRVLLFALAVSIASGLVFGLAPALRVPVRGLEHVLRAGARTVAGSSRRLHGAFVVSELVLAVMLLVSAGMLGRTLLHLSSLDPGVNLHNVLTARVALSPATLADPGRIRAAWPELLARLRAVPGVQAVATVDTVPMRSGNNPIGYSTSAAPPPPDRTPYVMANSVSPDYLKVMGLQLRRGRFLDEQDRKGKESVVVIDDVMAQQAFAGQNPIGQHLWIGLGSDPVRVVGVVGHVRYWGPAEDDQATVRAQLYYPFDQVPDTLLRRWSELMSIAVRTSTPPLGLVESLRRAARGATGEQVIYQIGTLEQFAGRKLEQQRFLLLLFGVFAGLALLLASIGIYGVLAYLTGQRVPEIGVRMALGASSGDVLRMVLKQSLAMIGAGVVLGTLGTLAAGRVLMRMVQGMQPIEVSTVLIMIGVLVVAALLASFVPARRASRIDPLNALRQE
jgi:predicted permease